MPNGDIIAIMAVVVAFVAYFKAFKIIETKYLPLVALGLSYAFVITYSLSFDKPLTIFDTLMLGSMIGLGATGFYHTQDKK